MKVLFISHFYYPHVGGVEKHVENLCTNLISRGHQVTVVTKKFQRSLKERETVNKIRIIRFDFWKTKFLGLLSIWFWFLRNRELIKESDLIHCHDVFIWYLPFRFLYSKKPIYTTFHGYEGYPIKFLAKIIRKISEKLSLGNICIGHFISKWYGTEATVVSYGAVDLAKFDGSKTNLEYDAVFFGRLDEQTGILTYLAAVKELREKGVNLKLIVLGDGKYRCEVNTVTTTKGFVDNPAPYLKKSRFVFASRYLAILEAFATKRLVFAVYDNPIKKDYLMMSPFAKWIIIEKSPSKLAKKVLFFIKNSDKVPRYTIPAYKWVKNQSWEKMTNSYLNLWGIKDTNKVGEKLI